LVRESSSFSENKKDHESYVLVFKSKENIELLFETDLELLLYDLDIQQNKKQFLFDEHDGYFYLNIDVDHRTLFNLLTNKINFKQNVKDSKSWFLLSN
jgi:hypothetical protein